MPYPWELRRRSALVAYLRSLDATREIDVELVLLGHGALWGNIVSRRHT